MFGAGVLGALMLMALQHPGEGLGWIVAGGVAMLVFCRLSDVSLPSSRRHVIATLVAGLILCVGGFRLPFVGVPGIGSVSLDAITASALTLIWVFVIVGLVEVLALLPLLTGLLCLVIGLVSFVPGLTRETYAGSALGGVLVGAMLGRAVAEVLRRRPRIPSKSETLFVAYLVAAATLALFVKSLTLAGLVLPVGIVTIVMVILAVQGFERSLVLRPSPRE